jgi:GNAT superfamily N-acetyltransferase
MTGRGPLIRPMTPADRPALADFPNRVSAGSAIFRFHGSVTVLTDKTLDLLLDLAGGQREAIIAVDDRGIAGVARFARDDLDPAVAEVAILVADEWQHRGLARQLLRPLAERARSAGIERRRHGRTQLRRYRHRDQQCQRLEPHRHRRPDHQAIRPHPAGQLAGHVPADPRRCHICATRPTRMC